jgi:hypothetical protein
MESKEFFLESLSFNVGTSIHVNQLYKGFNWGRRKSSPLCRIHQVKVHDDRANVCANRKLKQIGLSGFLQPNQLNPLISLLNFQKPPMALAGNLQQIPNVVNQGNWMIDQSMLHPYLYLLNNKVWIMIAILLNSWPLTLQIMQGLMNIRK